MKRLVMLAVIAAVAVMSPAVAQEWQEFMEHATRVCEKTGDELAAAMEQLHAVQNEEIREVTLGIMEEVRKQLGELHEWSAGTLDRMHRERAEQEERMHGERMHGERMHGERMREERMREERGPRPREIRPLDRTLRLTFESEKGPLTVLCATNHFEAGGEGHHVNSAAHEGEETAMSHEEVSWEVGGEIFRLDGEGRYLVIFNGNLREEEGHESIAQRAGETEEERFGGVMRFQGSAIMRVGESKLVYGAGEDEVHLSLEEG